MELQQRSGHRGRHRAFHTCRHGLCLGFSKGEEQAHPAFHDGAKTHRDHVVRHFLSTRKKPSVIAAGAFR